MTLVNFDTISSNDVKLTYLQHKFSDHQVPLLQNGTLQYIGIYAQTVMFVCIWNCQYHTGHKCSPRQ